MEPVLILIKNEEKHKEFNSRLLEYVNDRHSYINNNGFRIKFDIIDSDNMDDYVSKGVESIPAMLIHTDVVHGVNTILSDLAKLEMIKADPPARRGSSEGFETEKATQPKTGPASFHDMAMREMLSGDQEDESGCGPSTVSIKNQNVETPMDDKTIEDKRAVYDSMMADRKSRSQRANKSLPKSSTRIAPQKDLFKTIQNENYDKGEEMFMKSVIANMNRSDDDGDY